MSKSLSKQLVADLNAMADEHDAEFIFDLFSEHSINRWPAAAVKPILLTLAENAPRSMRRLIAKRAREAMAFTRAGKAIRAACMMIGIDPDPVMDLVIKLNAKKDEPDLKVIAGGAV